MTFIDDNAVKEFRWILLVVYYSHRRPALLVTVNLIFYIFIFLRQLFSLQDRIHPLNRADIDLI